MLASNLTNENQHNLEHFLLVSMSDAFNSLIPENSKEETFSFTEYEDDSIVPATWLSMILVTSRDFEMRFTINFHLHQIENLAKRALSSPIDQPISRGSSFDVVREICNTVAGYLKNRFYQKSIECGFSLPLLTNGFDQLIINKAFEVGYQKKYLVTDAHNRMICKYDIVCKDWPKLRAIDFADVHNNKQESGIIELL